MSGVKNIVLVHGWGANTEKLKPLSEELKSLGWRIFLIKIPGFDVPAPDSVWGVKEYSNYLYKNSLDFFKNQPFYVFGHSFGGRLAIKLASSPKPQIKGIILCSTSGISRLGLLRRTFFKILARMVKIFIPLEGLAYFLRKLIYKLAGSSDYQKTEGIIREIFKKVIAEDLKPLLKQINIPTLILWGGKDRVTPLSDALFIKQQIPLAKTVIFNEEDHRLPYNKAGQVAFEIEKWAKNLK